jgi:competence protein ComEA
MQQLRALARRKALLAAAIIAATGILVLAVSYARRPPASAPPTIEEPLPADDIDTADAEPSAAPAAASTPAETVIVYISGAVRAPDVYRLPAEARVKDLVLAAGGFAQDADPERVNLAERLQDEKHIHIPRQGEEQAGDDGGTQAAAAEDGALIDINTASDADLDGLPGIGQALAQRIVEYRAANGPFKSVDDLRNVKGIGPALFAKIAPLVTAGL